MSVANDTSYEMFACYHNIFIHDLDVGQQSQSLSQGI